LAGINLDQLDGRQHPTAGLDEDVVTTGHDRGVHGGAAVWLGPVDD
jgi:hypothetical protein